MTASALDGLPADDPGTGLEFLGRRTSGAALARQVELTAGGLAARGIGSGDLVALFLPNAPPAVVALLAALRVGADVMPLDPREDASRLSARLRQRPPRLIVTLDVAAVLDRLLPLLTECPDAEVAVARYAGLLPFPRNLFLPFLRGVGLGALPPDPRFLRFDALQRAVPPPAPPGVPARLVLADGTHSPDDLPAAAEVDPGARWLLGGPLCDPAGLAALLAALRAGATLLLSPRLDPAGLAEAARRGRATRIVPEDPAGRGR